MEDIDNFFYTMALMFTVDLVATIITSVCLRYFCQINLFQEFCNAMKKYWILLIIRISMFVTWFAYNDVNGGMDMTFEFAWTTAEGRVTLFNATNTNYQGYLSFPLKITS